MFQLKVSKNHLELLEKEIVTSGSVNTYLVEFQFQTDWDGMHKMAVFSAGDCIISVPLEDSNQCMIPWEVMEKPGLALYVGVYGTKEEEVVLPTVWARLGLILPGTKTGAEPYPPTPDAYQMLQNQMGDLEDLKTKDHTSLVAAINELTTGGNGNLSSPDIQTIRVLDRADYDALETKDAATLYMIRG